MPIVFKSTLNYEVKWFCNETLITNNEKYVVLNDTSSTTLLIRSIEQSDQQQYKLVISNPQDTITYKTFLNVESNLIVSFFFSFFWKKCIFFKFKVAKKVAELKPSDQTEKIEKKQPKILKSLEPSIKIFNNENAW